jgi:hypothetical protein
MAAATARPPRNTHHDQPRSPVMKIIRNALLGAAGLVALSLPAHALGSATVTDTPVLTSKTTVMQLSYSTSAGSVGFKKTKKKKAKSK